MKKQGVYSGVGMGGSGGYSPRYFWAPPKFSFVLKKLCSVSLKNWSPPPPPIEKHLPMPLHGVVIAVGVARGVVIMYMCYIRKLLKRSKRRGCVVIAVGVARGVVITYIIMFHREAIEEIQEAGTTALERLQTQGEGTYLELTLALRQVGVAHTLPIQSF